MKFSAQEEFGLRCLLLLAHQGPEGSLTISEIGKAEGLSPTNAAKLLMNLRKKGFIVSTRGHQGGYTLARPADQIFVGHVLEALGGKLFDEAFCGKHKGLNAKCAHSVDCSVRGLWELVQSTIDKVVDRVTLADLMVGSESNVSFSVTSPKRTNRPVHESETA